MYPIMVDLSHKPVLVVGGGKVARRKVQGLLAAGADVTVISPQIEPELKAMNIRWIQRQYQSGDTAGAVIVFACTDQATINQQIYRDASPACLVNNTGNKAESDFYNVAWTQVDDLSIMISTQGRSPERAKQVRQEIYDFLKKE